MFGLFLATRCRATSGQQDDELPSQTDYSSNYSQNDEFLVVCAPFSREKKFRTVARTRVFGLVLWILSWLHQRMVVYECNETFVGSFREYIFLYTLYILRIFYIIYIMYIMYFTYTIHLYILCILCISHILYKTFCNEMISVEMRHVTITRYGFLPEFIFLKI